MSQLNMPEPSDSTLAHDTLSRFNKVAWVVCTYGLGAFVTFASMGGDAANMRSVLDFVLALIMVAGVYGTYLLFPNYLYQRQVVQGIKLSGGWVLAFIIYTGAIFGVIAVLIFDILRHILKVILRPQGSERIAFMYIGRKTK